MMKKLVMSVFFVACAFGLASCKEDKVNKGAEYKTIYGNQYETLNYIVSSTASDSVFFANNVDGMLENDKYGKLIPSLAKEDAVVSEDAKTFTYKLREGMKWSQQDGSTYKLESGKEANVVADDFVAAADYILNPKNASQVTGLWFMFVSGARARYCSWLVKNAVDSKNAIFDTDKNGTVTAAEVMASNAFQGTIGDQKDLLNVETPQNVVIGVKAIDTLTVEYKLNQSAPFFQTALTYSAFYPVNREYSTKYGEKFGENARRLLYNGAYIMTVDNQNEKIVQTKNQNYWDKDNVKIDTITYNYYDQTTLGPDFARKLFENGAITGFAFQEDDVDGWKKYIYGDDGKGTKAEPASELAVPVTTVSEYTYYMLYNFNRTNFKSTGHSEAQKTAVNTALSNKNFRQGMFYGLDSTPWREYYNKDNPGSLTRRTYMMAELAVDNKGTDYIDYMYAEYAKQNNLTTSTDFAVQATAGKAVIGDGAATTDGKDLVFDVEKAKAAFAKAKAEMPDIKWPIRIECIAPGTSKIMVGYYQNMANLMNTAFTEYVDLVLLQYNSDTDWQAANNNMDHDLRFYMGWGPDYADPQTYLNTYVKSNGDMLDYSGFDGTAVGNALEEKILGEFTALVDAANQITDPNKMDERYAKLAEAEYKLLFEDCIIVPYFARNTQQVQISKIKPYTSSTAPYGLAKSKYKGMEILEKAITTAERKVLHDAYMAEKNKKAA